MPYVCRNKVTGLYLPPIPGRTGSTFLEPGPIPRIFTKAQFAQHALRRWLKGEFHGYRMIERIPEEWEVRKVEIVLCPE